MNVKLRVSPSEGKPFDFMFEDQTLTLGRSSSSDLALADQSISRKHARLFFCDERLMLEDLNSHNGTRLNGLLIQGPVTVKQGMTVELGESTLTVAKIHGPDSSLHHPEEIFSDVELSSEKTLFFNASELLGSDLLGNDSDPVSSKEIRSRESERFIKRLKVLNEAHSALSRSISQQDLLDLILDWVGKNLAPEEASIFLKQNNGALYTAAHQTVSGMKREFIYSKNLVREVVEEGKAALIRDAILDERFTQAVSIISSGVRSLVAAPLLDQDGCLGMIVLNSQASDRQFSETDLETLVSVASVAALRLRNLWLAEEAAERRRMEDELALARKIQVALLPEGVPDLAGYEIFAKNVPSQGVSGDYYEVLQRNDDRECVFLIADVSGKGMGASLLTASLEALSAGPIEDGQPPAEICTRLSRMLFQRTTPEKYATLFLGVVDQATGTLTYCNAGHNPGILVTQAGHASLLNATGLPIGLWPSGAYDQKEVKLQPGDYLVLYTDGLTEAQNPTSEEYEIERLTEVCKTHGAKPPAVLAQAIMDHLTDFAAGVPFGDDLTLILVKRNA